MNSVETKLIEVIANDIRIYFGLGGGAVERTPYPSQVLGTEVRYYSRWN